MIHYSRMMFSSRGFFREVPCPERHNCALPNCLFSHESTLESETTSDHHQVYDPETTATTRHSTPIEDQQPVSPLSNAHRVVPLRPRSEYDTSSSDQDLDTGIEPQIRPLKRRHDSNADSLSQNDSKKRVVSDITDDRPIAKAAVSQALVQPPASVSRPISPPLRDRARKPSSSTVLPAAETKQEQLIPRKVTSVIPLPTRHSILIKFHDVLLKRNEDVRKTGKTGSESLLTAQELIKLSLAEEEQAAKAAAGLDAYKNLIAGRVSLFKKMAPLEMKNYTGEKQNLPPTVSKAAFVPSLLDEAAPRLADDLAPDSRKIAVLKLLRTGLHQHAKHGYVVKQPLDKDVQRALAADKANDGWETCDRCSTRFQVFRGRNKEGFLTSGGQCYYHWARPQMRGGQAHSYPCCSGHVGSTGCSSNEHHVFKISDPPRLATLLPFKETPTPSDKRERGPVVFDCEMGYTTGGLELIRLTALSWPSKKTLVDVLVRPIGEILDLNTRFSGVTQQMYNNAPDFGQNNRYPKYIPGEPLYKVASPAAARGLLFDHLKPDTPLLGHAIDNDLNACRIIHPFVIDTVLLYPHPRGLPIRYKLRDLASKYLKRTIQAQGDGGTEGHDSKEDSEATGDLVLVRVEEKWRELQRSGWWFKDNTLMPPMSKAAQIAAASAIKNS